MLIYHINIIIIYYNLIWLYHVDMLRTCTIISIIYNVSNEIERVWSSSMKIKTIKHEEGKKGRSFQILCRYQQGECVGSWRQIETSAKQNTPFGVCVSERPDLRGQVVSHRVPVIASDGIKRYVLRVGRYDFPKLPGQEDRPSLSIWSCKDSCVGGTVPKIWTFKFHRSTDPHQDKSTLGIAERLGYQTQIGWWINYDRIPKNWSIMIGYQSIYCIIESSSRSFKTAPFTQRGIVFKRCNSCDGDDLGWSVMRCEEHLNKE